MKNKFLLKACASNAERKIWSLLENLPDDYHVYAGVLGIQSEIDFLITHPIKGLLIIEVKGGFVSNQKVNGRDHITSQGREKTSVIKNPFQQASNQVYSLLDQLFKVGDLKNFWLRHSYAVCLPDNEFFEGEYPEMFEQGRLILKTDLFDIKRKIDKVYELSKDHSSKTFGHEAQAILKKILMGPEILFSDIIENNKIQNQQQTENSVISMFHRDDKYNSQIIINGPAGTGKTTLALEAAKKFEKLGKKTLFLCYNDPLKWMLKDKTKDFKFIETTNFHDFCERISKLANHERSNEFAHIRQTKPKEAQDFWNNQTPQILLESLIMLGERAPKFEAIIIDEAQDFKDEWHETLKIVLSTEAKEYIFSDQNQKIYTSDMGQPHAHWFHLNLNINYRLPADILDLSEKYNSSEQEIFNQNLMRQRLIIKTIKSEKDEAARLEKLINELINKEKVKASDICVLTARSPEKIPQFAHFFESSFKSFKATCRLSREYRQGVTFETIHRFKGLEAPIILIADLGSLIKQKDNKLLYTGLTRASTSLIILGTDAHLTELGIISTQLKKVA
jgi:hypothetical protein